MASVRKIGTSAATVMGLTLVATYVVMGLMMSGMDQNIWYDMNACFAYANQHAVVWHMSNILCIVFGMALVPGSIAAYQRYRQAGIHAVLMRSFGVVSGVLWILAGITGIMSLLYPQSLVTHNHPENAALMNSIVGAISWGVQSASTFTYGIFLYLAARSGMATKRLPNWAAYITLAGGIIGILTVPLMFAGDAASMMGGMLVPLGGIIFNIAFMSNLRNANDAEMEMAMS